MIPTTLESTRAPSHSQPSDGNARRLRTRPGRSLFAIATAAGVLAGVALLGCSSSSGPTDPNGIGSTGGSHIAPFDSGVLTAPATFVHTFPDSGTVGYHCAFHPGPGMTGAVFVVAGAADSVEVTADGTSFFPSGVKVRPGGFVLWNVIRGTHTVTSDREPTR